MSEAWVIAVTSLVVTTTLSLFGMGIKALWSIAKTFKELVTRPECDKAMGEQCRDIERLQKGFEENKSALRQIILIMKEKHGTEIEYEG